MEILGAVSSGLSALDVVIRSSNAIQKLITDWKDVPMEIVALANEVDDTKAVLNQAWQLIKSYQSRQQCVQNTFPSSTYISAIERQLKLADPTWKELHKMLQEFRSDSNGVVSKASKDVKFKWLKTRKRLERVKKKLRENRLNIMELMVQSSALQSYALEMQLVSISTNIKESQQTSTESLKHVHHKLKDIEHQLALMSKNHERGAHELANFFASCQSASWCTSTTKSFSGDGCATDVGDLQGVDMPTLNQARGNFSSNIAAHRIPGKSKPRGSSLPKGSDDYTSLYHLTFHQKTSYCDRFCQCVCHSRSRCWRGQFGASALFKCIFGSLLLGYSGCPVPKVTCDTRECLGSPPGFTVILRYSFPAWAANRVLMSLFSSGSNCLPNFALRVARRIPYAPGNIFSRINSRDFCGATELIRNGDISAHDIEARHGISILGATLRKPVYSPGLVQFLEFLLQRQVDPYVPNDEGESAWHFAARLMFPKTSTVTATAELQDLLHKLFPNPDWDIFQFTHLHKVVVGLRPINLVAELQNPKYRSKVNAKDALGQTPLGLAASLGDDQAVEALLSAGADPNGHAKSASSLRPLRKAIRARSTSCIELLLRASADPFALDVRGASILHTAAADTDDISIVRQLLQARIPLDFRNANKCTPLSFTPLKDNSEVARFLLSQGADINNVDRDGDTPLTESVRLKAHKCLKLFLDENADYRTVNKRGWTILHFVAAHADLSVLQILASSHLCGLDIGALDNQGKTPMDRFLERQTLPRDILERFKTLLKNISPQSVSLKGESQICAFVRSKRTNAEKDQSFKVFSWKGLWDITSDASIYGGLSYLLLFTAFCFAPYSWIYQWFFFRGTDSGTTMRANEPIHIALYG